MSVVIAVIVFSLLIFIHELGHFLLAKKNGIKVVEFSIGFGPRLFSFEKGGTRYSIKLLFFGGSCQMLSEDFFDEEELEKDQEHSFEGKSVWARIAVVIAGPFFNFLLAWVLAVVVMGSVGYDKPVINSIEKYSAAEEAGLQQGDLIKEFNGEKITLGREIAVELYINPIGKEDVTIVYERDGKTDTAVLTPKFVTKYAIGISYMRQEGSDCAEVTEQVEEGPFAEAGGQVGDAIIAINGDTIDNGIDLADYIVEHPFEEKETIITVKRDGENLDLKVTPAFSSEGYVIGLGYNTYRFDANASETLKYSFAEIKYQISSVFKSLGLLFKGELGADDFTGPVGIVDIIGTTYDSAKSEGAWMAFLNVANITVLLSANLGVMNLLPIPGVDGGRLFFLLIEAVTRKRVPRKFEGVLTAICMLLLMGFAVYVMYNDITRIF